MNAPFDTPAPVLRFGRAICGDLDQAERREWWLANGLGGYAAGTVAGTLTRRYHGLLFANVEPPVGRRLLLARADAEAIVDGRSWPLHTNRWVGGAIEPKGYLSIERFTLEAGLPVWEFRVGAAAVEHRVWMVHGENTTCLSWRLSGTPQASLRIRLLATNRDHHGGAIAGPVALSPASSDALDVSFDHRTTLRLHTSRGTLRPCEDWVRDFDLPAERARGLPDREDHLCVGEVECELREGEELRITASVPGSEAINPDPRWSAARGREKELWRTALDAHPEFAAAPDWVRHLVRAADAFVFRRQIGAHVGCSVIAGYPWFGDWGRDTMIALPGLTLATGRPGTAREILTTFAAAVDRGMLPNYFPGDGASAEYNTADATLWFIEAWRAYFEATGDRAALSEAWPVLCDIIPNHVAGTRYGIGVDPADGLLHAGEPGIQLTWMDAKVGDWVVTPRIGKPVEINALWFNALCAMGDFARLLGDEPSAYAAMADRVRNGFGRFAGGHGGGLMDVIDGPNGDEASLRPNQIFALSLRHSPLDAAAQAAVLRAVQQDLLTSYGLRSLAPSDPAYRPYYEGDVRARDGSYHQGAVWPWLLGPYALAEYRVTGDAAHAQARLAAIEDHLSDAALGTISEILDAAPPHLPRGAPAQAWSVACILDAWLTLEKARLAHPQPGDHP